MSQLVDLKVGFSCNNNCIHCVISDKLSEPDLSLTDIKNIVNNYIDQYNTIQLTLTGGEITIRKDFADILGFVQEKKDEGKITFVDMQTNARMLSKKPLAEIAAKTIDFFLIALHSNKPEIHDAITRSKGSFNQTTSAISNLIELIGTEKIAIQTVINRMNYNHLKDIYEYTFMNFGLKECNITFPHPIGVCKSNQVVPSYAEAQPYINEALSYCLSKGIFPFIEAVPYCVLNNGHNRDYLFDFIKRRTLDVVGYCGEKDGKLNYMELFDDGHSKYTCCSNCCYFSECEGVWKEYKEIYPSEDMYSLFSNSGRN